ncbi:hypothetical protein B0H14DRAFT_2569017 [Mycena olivaceomarginata]|nr:hypothetical protein B0H14DRAFT_2569017 [Mycena olivaceomarginata]
MIAGNPQEKGKVIPVMVRGFHFSAHRRIHTEAGTRFSDSPQAATHRMFSPGACIIHWSRGYPSPTFQLQVVTLGYKVVSEGLIHPESIIPELIFLLPWPTLQFHISRFVELMSILSVPLSNANCVTRLMYWCPTNFNVTYRRRTRAGLSLICDIFGHLGHMARHYISTFSQRYKAEAVYHSPEQGIQLFVQANPFTVQVCAYHQIFN